MTSRLLSLGLIATATLIAAPGADAKLKKKPRLDATYNVSVKADMKEQWNYRDYLSYDCLDGMCNRETLGSGSASAHLKTRRPFRMLVMRGAPGKPPILNQGSDGIPMTGGWLRGGTMTTTYSGAWDAANPDTSAPTTDCGNLTEQDFRTVGWSYERPWNLQLFTASEPLRDACPDGPPNGLDWEGGESPSLTDVLASVGKGKFLGTKQFTVRGTRSWTGTVAPTNRTDPQDTRIVNGQKTVTWQWEATFRMQGAKQKRHRRH